MKPRQEAQPERAPGCFNVNGSWNPNGTPAGHHKIHIGVMGLTKTRINHPDLLPKDFAGYIRADHLEPAFPNLAQWDACDNWLAAHGTSSAEALVKRAGGRFVPNPIGIIPGLTPEIGAVIESVTRIPVPRA